MFTKINKKIIICLLALIMVIGLTTTVFGSDKVTVTVWSSFAKQEMDVLKDLLVKEGFYNKYPNLEVKIVDAVSYDKMLASLAAGSPPDVTMGFGWEVGPWADAGALIAMDKYIEEHNVNLDNFLPSIIEQCQYKDHYYSLPLIQYPSTLFWNKKLFKKAGLDPERAPESIEELETYAKKLTKFDSSGNLSQVGILFNPNHFYEWAYVFGGKFYDQKKQEITANNPKNIIALEWQKNLIKQLYGFDKLKEFGNAVSEMGSFNPFYYDNVGMAVLGCWNIEFMKRYAPDVEYGVGTIPAPADKTELGGAVMTPTSTIIMPKGGMSGKPEEVFKFVEFITTNAEFASKFSDRIANLPHLKSSIKTDWTKDEKLKLFSEITLGNNAHHLPVTPVTKRFMDEMVSSVQDVYLGTGDPKDLLDKVTKTIEQEWSN